MDMQGTPTGSTNHGTKNISDHEAKFASTNEPTGAVVSDSLAAESSTFQRSNPGEPLAVDGSKSTFTNADIAGASTLPPARSASDREITEAQDARYPEGTGGVPKFAGGHNADGYSGGSAQAKQEIKREEGENATQPDTGDTSTSASSGSGNALTGYRNAGAGSEHPSAGSDESRIERGDASTHIGKPKGKNLTEGGFDDDDDKNNASYTADIGSENDPGRLTQQKFQMLNAATAGSNARPQEHGISGEGTYDALGAENVA